MKFVVFLAVASLAVMLVMVGQVVRQELNRTSLRSLAEQTATHITDMERSIEGLKSELQTIKTKHLSLVTARKELKTKKDDILKERKTLQDDVNKCKEEKGQAEKSKSDATENASKLKTEHDQAKQEAQKTIQDLKQKNLDREKTICASVDTTNAEARKLCGLQ